MNFEKAWLNYRKLPGDLPPYARGLYYTQDSPVVLSAVDELKLAVQSLYEAHIPALQIAYEDADSLTEGILLTLVKDGDLGEEGFHLYRNKQVLAIEAGAPAGILYGVFHLIRKLRAGEGLEALDERQLPEMPLRMLNHWDNMDGTIERGYSGRSFFFENNELVINERTLFYARLLSSVGINATVINNVNVKEAATFLITERYREPIKRLAEILAAYHIRLFLSINYAAPMELGGLPTADPCDERVGLWWQEQAKALFTQVPNLGGFLVKADSEGRPGPFTYGRTQAEGANMLARAVKPYQGIIIWRCFVYNCQQDWRDRKTDRARAAYDHFKPLDGQFDDNVILQIKNGPMDFQVREPVSPLLGAMKETHQMMEVQIAQEYTGQQRHVCYLIPLFKEVLRFRTFCGKEKDSVAHIISGKTYGNTRCGMAAVSNTGDDTNWTGHDLAAANLYGFGRLSFDPSLSSEAIAMEWARQTFGNQEEIAPRVTQIFMMSWPAYEKYSSPLGIGWMVNPHNHYGPSVDGYEYDRWGTYHRADHRGIGVDRSSQGTGYASLYHEPHKSVYDRVETCPEELLLFFHHVPYTHRLKTGKTVIQHIYDTHFEGVEDVIKMKCLWKELQAFVDKKIFERVSQRLEEQLKSAEEWRDVVNTYFLRKTGIPDEKGRLIF